MPSFINVDNKLSFSFNLETGATKTQKLDKNLELFINRIITRKLNLLDSNSKFDSVKILKDRIIVTTGDKTEEIEYTKKTKKIASNILKSTKTNSLELKRDRVGEALLKSTRENLLYKYYLFSSGGGGHKSAKDAKVDGLIDLLYSEVKASCNNQQLTIEVDDKRLTNPESFKRWCVDQGLIHESDVLHDFLGRVGRMSSASWDKAQAEGKVDKQEQLASMQWLSDIIFGPVVFLATLNHLIAYRPKEVISTQAMATPSILYAIKIYNNWFKSPKEEPTQLHLYMTDMPTKYSTHFFGSLKKISEFGGKSLLHLYAPKTKKSMSLEELEKLCGLEGKQIHMLETMDLPVRPAFVKAASEFKPNLEHPTINIKVTGAEELALLNKTLQVQSGETTTALGDSKKTDTQTFDYQMNPEDKGVFLMLGSKPTHEAIKGYVDEFIELAKNDKTKAYHLFAFTGKFEDEQVKGAKPGQEQVSTSFYKILSKHIEDKKKELIAKGDKWPENLRVVPLSYQEPKQLVSLFLQCDSITRSGGSTIFELLVIEAIRKALGLPEHLHLIHSQQVDGKTLERSIPVWEFGNYESLLDELQARIVKVVAPGRFQDPMKTMTGELDKSRDKDKPNSPVQLPPEVEALVTEVEKLIAKGIAPSKLNESLEDLRKSQDSDISSSDSDKLSVFTPEMEALVHELIKIIQNGVEPSKLRTALSQSDLLQSGSIEEFPPLPPSIDVGA